MDAGIIVAAITAFSAVLVAIIGAKSNATNRDILSRLEQLERLQVENALFCARTDLLQSLAIEPCNTMEILKIARRYFLELHGNSYASVPFVSWAIAHNIDIDRFYTTENDLEFLVKRYRDEAKVKSKGDNHERNH